VLTIAELIHSIIIILTLLVPGSMVAQGQVQGQGQIDSASVNVFVIGSATAKTHQLDLKGIEGESPTRNFVIKPESVVQVKQGDSLVVFTQPINQVVESVKVQNASGIMTTLTPLGINAYSLAGLPTGVYILDVIVDLGSDKKGAYETILVILQKDQQPVQPAQVINRVQVSDDGDNGNQSRPPPGECEPGYVLVGNNCEPIVCPAGSGLDSNGRICEPIPNPDPDCDPSRPECAPTQCPDGRIVPPGKPCPDDALPCDDPNAPEWCSVPTECADGTIIPPGEQCPDVDYGGEDSDNDQDQDDQGQDQGDAGEGGGNSNDNGDDEDSSDDNGDDSNDPESDQDPSGEIFD
jgi:hypothetical protein